METVASKCEELKLMRNRHLEVGRLFLGPKGTVLRFVDMLAIAVLDRSLSLVRAFLNLVADENMIAAAILCRCQLDNGLRFFATSLTDYPSLLVKRILLGLPINDFKDRTGSRMTDSHLVKELSKQVVWVEVLDKQASGYVHLSEQHMRNSFGPLDQSENSINKVKIDGRDGEVWTTELYVEAIHSFCAATQLLLEAVEMWATCDKRKLEGRRPCKIEEN